MDPERSATTQPWYAWLAIAVMFIMLLAFLTVMIKGYPPCG